MPSPLALPTTERERERVAPPSCPSCHCLPGERQLSTTPSCRLPLAPPSTACRPQHMRMRGPSQSAGVHMYMYMHVHHGHGHVRTCTRVVHMYMCACAHVRMSACVHVYMCTCVHVYMCTCVHVYMCTCVHVRTCACCGSAQAAARVHVASCTLTASSCMRMHAAPAPGDDVACAHVYVCILSCVRGGRVEASRSGPVCCE